MNERTPVSAYGLLSSPCDKSIVFVSSRGSPCKRTSTGTNKMRKTNALYLKRQRLIAETQTCRHTQRDTHNQRETHTYKELLEMFTLPFASHMNLNTLLLLKHLNIQGVPWELSKSICL